ncbi:MAG: glycogen debranching protein [Candidatus Terrybacteria bacterium]|nr:glycogen debranching protein [Candidatus Terrybacteria bacterium]
MNKEALQQLRERAVAILLSCASPLGFLASARADGYPQVWARDSMMVALAVLATGHPRLQAVAKRSIVTLAQHQDDLGWIPTNVQLRTRRPDRTTPGAVDSNSWWIIGLGTYVRLMKDRVLKKRLWGNVERALAWLHYQDQNRDGLLELQEAADWEDLLAIRGTGLTVNVLYAQALKTAAALAPSEKRRKALQALFENTRRRINRQLWITPSSQRVRRDINLDIPQWRGAHLVAHQQEFSPPYYLPYYTMWQCGQWFDSLGNLLAIVTGVASRRRARTLLRFMAHHNLARPFPTKAIYPPLRPRESDWREYYRKYRLNLPHCYHNGGIWPMIGGWHVLALAKIGERRAASRLFLRLAAANRATDFNEWLHGKTGKPSGMKEQAWSAGMFLLADHVLKTGHTVF